MKKLVYANSHHKLDVPNELYTKYERLRTSGLQITGSMLLPRSCGSDFHTPMFPIPNNISTHMSFASATNLRVHEVMAYAETNDLPIVAMYSGGIDSTVIVTAIMQHFPKALLDRVIVCMSNASYVENPYFFNRVIKPYLKYSYNTYDYNDAIILHGDPADALWLGGNILNLCAKYPGASKFTLHEHKDILMRYLIDKSDEVYAEWLYEHIMQESKVAGFGLYTISDFFWWMIFNYNFSSMCFKHLGETTNIDLDKYADNFFNWYSSYDYQIWSIQAQTEGTKFDGSIRSYKMEAKEYIYEYDKNLWYKDYKTKVHSQYRSLSKDTGIVAIYDNGEIITNG